MRDDYELDNELGNEHHDEQDGERGDVPGWVLVTLMTAGLVVALWAVAGPLLENAFRQAISSVTGQG
ncbi:hypothetical protein [Promicromonospora iranensis]|uniref:Flagellin-like protein n=1 Tax=Promicromonospora iranensis TaxID=1105144 RepID=A0ABU2CKZ8_9MICO|nr:hypothetical protein [Promicromonospora iranensis]MDR7382010.1 hypothetical protein [Promicromonospora iranensis]